MILYHGSNVEVSEPKLLKVQRALDFGKGFYTTTDLEQALIWAKRTARIRKTGAGQVSVYKLDDDIFAGLKVLHFEKADGEWLEYVTAEQAVANLLPQKLKDQLVFKTEKAISTLEYIEGICV